MTPDDHAASRPTNATPPTRAPDAVREGDYLVVRKRGVKLPPGCIWCSAPEAGRVPIIARGATLPVAATVALLSLGPLFHIALHHAPRAEFEGGLCASHIEKHLVRKRAIRRMLLQVFPLLAVALVALWFGLPGMVVVAPALAALGLLCSILRFSAQQTIVLGLHHSHGRYMWVRGISPEYLQQLPEIGGES